MFPNQSLHIVFICFLLQIIACGDNPGSAEAIADTTVASAADTVVVPNEAKAMPANALDIEPRLSKTDSLEILYFDDPDGDSLRYTRFYKYVATADTVVKNLVLSDLGKNFIKRPGIIQCRSEGKVFMHAGANPVKTLYFSTRGDSCSYLYMISNGEFFYFQLSDLLSSNLKTLKKTAKKP